MNLPARFLPETLRASHYRSRRRRYLPLIIVCFSLGWASVAASGNGDPTESLATEPAANDGWEFSFMLYGWLPWIELETSGTEVGIGADTLLDKLNMTAQFEVEARRGRWGLSTDVIYLDVNFDLEGQLLRDFEMRGWIVTPKLSYRVWEGRRGHLDLQAGARYYTLGVNLEGEGPLGESDSYDIWDGVIGLRANYSFTERWYLPLLADVGAGESDIQTQFYTGLGYRFKQVADVALGFRLLYYDFPSEFILKNQIAYGPILSIKFTF